MPVRPVNHRAVPTPSPSEGGIDNERRHRAEVQRALGVGELNFQDLDGRLRVIESGVGTYVYVVTSDAGDGTVHDDANNSSFLGQQGSIDGQMLVPNNSFVYVAHKGLLYIYVGPRPVLIGLGKPYFSVEADFFAIGTAVDWDDIVNKPVEFPPEDHTHPWDEITEKPTEFPPEDHTHLEEDITDLDKYTQAEVDALIAPLTEWRGSWAAGTYESRQQVFDEGWLLIANKQTSQRAAPQRRFDEQYDMPEAPAWVTNTHTGVVEAGRQWDITSPVTFVGFEIWTPDIGTDVNTVVRLYKEPTGRPELREFLEIAEPVLIEDGWSLIRATQTLLISDTTLVITQNTLNSGSSTAPGGTPADWSRGGNSNNGDPGVGEWNRSNNSSTLRIHETTADAALIDLNGVVEGSTFQFVSTDNSAQSITYRAESGESYANGVYSWSVDTSETGSGGSPPVGQRCIVTITVPLPAPTRYVQLAGGNPAVPWANTKGLLRLDDVLQSVDGDAFGVRALTDEWDVSPDWDIQSYERF